MYFLGWDIYNNRDSASIDGIFPFVINNDNIPTIINSDDLNTWGLLVNKEICQKYLDKNKNEVKIYVNNSEHPTKWETIAIYCDEFTFRKLKELNNFISKIKH